MTIHCIHLFDRRGKTLFTKTYSSVAAQQQIQGGLAANTADYGDSSPVEEQRKLVFGMLYSLGELIGKLSPEDENASLQSVETGAATVHNYETISGLRFALYTSINVPNSKTSALSPGNKHSSSAASDDSKYVHDALRHVYANIWVECVVRSPMYKPGLILAVGEKQSTKVGGEEKFDIATTNFEKQLDQYLTSLSWFR